MKKLLTVLATALAVAVSQFALADALGTWLLNGTDGDVPANGTEIASVAGDSLTMTVVSDGSVAPFYSNEGMPPFSWEVYDSGACNQLLGTVTNPLYLRKSPASTTSKETVRGVSIAGFGSAVNPQGTCGSWTVEFVARYALQDNSVKPLMYVKPDNAITGNRAFAIVSVNTYSLRMMYFDWNGSEWGNVGNVQYSTTAANTVFDGKWHHFAMTYNAETRLLAMHVDYSVNPVASVTLAAETMNRAISSNSTVEIGPNTVFNSWIASYPYQQLATARVSAGVLSANQFLSWTASEGATLGFWKFDGADGVSETGVIDNQVEGSPVSLNAIVSGEFPKYTDGNVPPEVKIYSDLSLKTELADVSGSLCLADTAYPSSGILEVGSGVNISGLGQWMRTGDLTIELIGRYAISPADNACGAFFYMLSDKTKYRLLTIQNDNLHSRTFLLEENTSKMRGEHIYQDRQETMCEGGWHHIALVYNSATQQANTFVDYVEVPDLAIDFSSTSGFYSLFDSDTTVLIGPNAHFKAWMQGLPKQQLLAVRVTKAALPASGFMTWATDEMAQDDTVMHWRFEGTPGVSATTFDDLACPSRSDLRCRAAVWADCGYGFDANVFGKYRKLKIGGTVLDNSTALGSFTSPISLHWNGASALVTKDYTLECFFMLNEYPSTGNTRAILYEEWGKNDKLFRVVCSSENKWDAGYQRFVVCAQVAKQDGTFEERKIIPASAIELKKWHRFALVIRESAAPRQMEYWLDGELVGAVALAEGESFVRSAKGFYMGSTYSNTAHPEYDVYNEGNFFGKIDEVRVSRKALAPSEFIDREKFGLFLMVK